MGKKTAFLLAHLLLVIATYVVAIFTIVGWFAGIVPPQNSWLVTIISLGMMPLLVVNTFLFIWWLCQLKFLAILPLGVILLNVGFITSMFQFDFREEKGLPNLKIASYNMHGFAQSDLKGSMENIVLFLGNEKVDIVCFQEFWATPKYPLDSIRETFRPVFPYCAALAQQTGLELAIFSKYPISDFSLLSFPGTANSTIWADVDIPGHPVRLFNAHFQTTNFNQSQKEINRLKDKGISDRTGKEAFDVIMDRLRSNAYQRTEQVERVRGVMDRTSRPIIFCGDFNDTPASYTYKRIKEGLIDGFKSSGKGYGSTYKPLMRIFRLDYILYDPEFEGVLCYSPNLLWSDHNPVIQELRF